MTPTIGRIVIYNTTVEDRNKLNAEGVWGNRSYQLPAIVLAVWSDTLVNLKVIGDAPIDLWKTSVNLRDEANIEGTWEWPVINK